MFIVIKSVIIPSWDLLRLQGLPLICASTCCKAGFRFSFGSCRRSHGLNDWRYVLESVGNKLRLVGLVRMKSEKSLCNRWMHVWAATTVNAKGLCTSVAVHNRVGCIAVALLIVRSVLCFQHYTTFSLSTPFNSFEKFKLTNAHWHHEKATN